MKRILLYAAAAAALAIYAIPAKAVTVDDPLHGYCNGCVDNGTNTPLIGSIFGFQSSPPGATGTLILDFLIPNNLSIPAPTIIGPFVGTATLFSTTAWTSGKLGDYLGGAFANSSPANPIGAYLPTTQLLDPGATGFLDYLLNVGTLTLVGTNTVPPVLYTLAASLPDGSYIVGKLVQADGSTINTANSAALLAGSVISTPLPAAVWLFGTGLVGLIGLSRRKRKIAATI